MDKYIHIEAAVNEFFDLKKLCYKFNACFPQYKNCQNGQYQAVNAIRVHLFRKNPLAQSQTKRKTCWSKGCISFCMNVPPLSASTAVGTLGILTTMSRDYAKYPGRFKVLSSMTGRFIVMQSLMGWYLIRP